MKKLLFLSLILLLVGCSNVLEDAQDSIEGNWSIISIHAFDNNLFFLEENDVEGFFEIKSTTIDYSFEFGGENFENNYEYQLERTRENAGFFKVDRFKIEGEETYIVKYGDETNDAHVDATMIELEGMIFYDSINRNVLIRLSKN